MKNRILLLDDDVDTLELNSKILKRSSLSYDLEIITCESIANAKKLISKEKFDLGLIDLNYKGEKDTGFDFIRFWRSQEEAAQIIVVSSSKDFLDIKNSIKAGANDFLSKGYGPFELEHRVRVSIERKKALNRDVVSKYLLKEDFDLKWKLLGRSNAILDLHKKIEKLASRTVSVLIEGETGVGKELVARNLHYRGNRASEPFVAVNCSAIPSQLAESMLFGHEKGAFTGASEKSIGVFERANGGTLFLDEINSLSLDLQAKLLRVIQDGIVYRVGSSKSISVDIRLISASNEKLEDSKKFRTDLFYRIAAVTLSVAPLRKRKEDILDLVQVFSKKRKISKEIKAIFLKHTWPGNVRELKNVIDGMLALSDDSEVLGVTHLPNHLFYQRDEKCDVKSRAEIRQDTQRQELEFFSRAYRLSNGNLSQLSRTLAMDRSHLHQKLVKMGIHRTR
ncbi:MAG: sigma-54 dependent transcriptional regulator [Oligoflexia bacterium]|nr:sigma-54 dependent transcriptional regulator [Oligoflexia bacterium]